MVGVFLALAFVSLGCSGAGPEESEEESSDDELVLGSRLRSPLVPGIYEQASSPLTLFVWNYADRQRLAIVDQSAPQSDCALDVDVSDGAATATSVRPACETKLQLHQGSSDISVKGYATLNVSDGRRSLDTKLERRKPNGLAGAYREETTGAALSVRASDDTKISVELDYGGVRVSGDAPRYGTDVLKQLVDARLNDFYAVRVDGNCSLAITLHKSVGGVPFLMVYPDAIDGTKCADRTPRSYRRAR